jgi:multimeric flavodoxin WrbA
VPWPGYSAKADRKDGITDQTVDAILEAARGKGAETKKIYLADAHIEFCANCRRCTKDSPEKRRGQCIFNDDMDKLLSDIDDAGGLVLASPINFGTVTALMKRFIERLIVYTYWPWDKNFPGSRIKERDKKAVVITSSACPAFIGRILMPSALNVMKECAGVVGAKTVKALYFGTVCREERQRLDKKQRALAESAGSALVRP